MTRNLVKGVVMLVPLAMLVSVDNISSHASAAAAAGTLTQISLSGETAVAQPTLGTTASTGPGGGPSAVAFDGVYVWVARIFSNTVTRIRASDGLKSGTFNVGERPAALAVDKGGLWVANGGADTVVGLNPKTGATSVTFVTGRSPSDVISDGVNIWIANRGSDSVSTTAAVQ